MPNLFRATMGGGSDIEPYIVIVTLNEDFAGQTVTLEQSGQDTLTKVCPTSAPFEVTFKPMHDGVWIAKSTTIDGKESVASTEPLLEWGTYTVELKSGFNFEEWLTQGRVTETFASLDDVLADEKTIRQLMTVHDSVDFLANNITDEDATKIFSNDLCAKWINLRDYALDTLYANDTCKTAMDNADKYFYGEWALVGQVPKLSADNDNIICFTHYDSNIPYYAFDESNATFWWGNGISATDVSKDYIGYSFDKPIEISKVIFSHYQSGAKRNSKLRIEYSDDKTVWHNATEDSPTNDVTTPQSVDVPSCGEHKYWRAFFTKNNPSTDANVKIASIQFYAWQPKGNVPIMTSATAPYGEVDKSAENTSNSRFAWKVFDGSFEWGNQWDTPNNTTTAWVQYKFVNPTKVKRMFACFSPNNEYAIDFQAKLMVSNDGTFTDLPNATYNITKEQNSSNGIYLDVPNDNYYLYYRFVFVTNNIYVTYPLVRMTELQFYGRELSVSVPKMTSDTEPYGVVSSKNNYHSADSENWYAFDKRFNRSGGTTGTPYFYFSDAPDNWVQYEFPHKVVIKQVSFTTIHDQTTSYYDKFYGSASVDGINFDPLINTTAKQLSTYTEIFDVNPDNEEYKYFRFCNCNTTYSLMNELNFYGLDYSERDFATEKPSKYIYDHGVELEEIEILTPAAIYPDNVAEKRTSEIYLAKYDSTHSGIDTGAGFSTSNNIDLSNYKLCRAVFGSEGRSRSSSDLVHGWYASKQNKVLVSNVTAFVNVTKDLLPNSISFDISNVEGLNYIVAGITTSGTATSSMSFKELWLEK